MKNDSPVGRVPTGLASFTLKENWDGEEQAEQE